MSFTMNLGLTRRLVRAVAAVVLLVGAGFVGGCDPVSGQPAGSGSGCGPLAGVLANTLINESSGLAVSRHWADVYWTHNDSGGEPRVYAVGADASDLGYVDITGAKARDWEDMASFYLDGESWLLLADTGDNLRRRDVLNLYLLREPPVAGRMQSVQRDSRVLRGLRDFRDLQSVKRQSPDAAGAAGASVKGSVKGSPASAAALESTADTEAASPVASSATAASASVDAADASATPQNSSAPVDFVIDFSWPDGEHFDCEAVAVNTLSRQIYLATKHELPFSCVFAIDLPSEEIFAALQTQGPQRAAALAGFDRLKKDSAGVYHYRGVPRLIGFFDIPVITAMDISADGHSIAVLSYTGLYEYKRPADKSWPQTLKRGASTRIQLPLMKQPEAACYGQSPATITVTSEQLPATFITLSRQGEVIESGE